MPFKMKLDISHEFSYSDKDPTINKKLRKNYSFE